MKQKCYVVIKLGQFGIIFTTQGTLVRLKMSTVQPAAGSEQPKNADSKAAGPSTKKSEAEGDVTPPSSPAFRQDRLPKIRHKAIGILSQAVLLLVVWLQLVLLVGAEALPGGGLWKMLVLVLAAELAGAAVELLGLPGLLGMLLAGIAARSTGLYSVAGKYVVVVGRLREVALAVILMKAGLGLDPHALSRVKYTVLNLSLGPGTVEAVSVAVVSHFFLGFPWLWGFALGFLMCAVSPAVVVPPLLKLRKEGYGEEKAISTLIIASSAFDDVLAITVFSISVGAIFSSGDTLASEVIRGPLAISGLGIGVLWGLLCGVIPNLDDEYLVSKRVAMLLGGGVVSVMGSTALGYPGAGPLACITAPIVATVLWSRQGWDIDYSPVEEVVSFVWRFVKPVLFGMIGAEIDLRELERDILSWGLIVIVSSLLMRIIACTLILAPGNLNLKEIVFVNITYLPKATVQAALGPKVLDLARRSDHPEEQYLRHGAIILQVAVLSILVTAPIGAVGCAFAGPRLLTMQASSPPPDSPRQRSRNTVIDF